MAISFFSVIGLVQSTLKQKKGFMWKPVMRGLKWKKSLIVLLSLLAYVLLLKPLGFLLVHYSFRRFFIGGRATPEMVRCDLWGPWNGNRDLRDF